MPEPLLPRPSLQRRLDALSAVVLIEGLPGLGKTTLAATWVRSLEHRARVCWVTAAPEVDDATSMMDAVAAGLSPTEQRDAGDDGHGEPRRSGLAAVRSALLRCAAPVVIVIDGVERVTSFAAIDQLMGLARSHANLHLVMCGRDLAIAKEAARRHRVEVEMITGSELMISAEELRTLTALGGWDVPDEYVSRISAQVGGWIEPIRRVLDASVGDPVELRTHTARHFIERSVVEELDGSKSLAVAMRLSVPETIDEELADSLLSSGSDPCRVPSSGALAIAEMERAGVLSPAQSATGRAEWTFAREIRDVLHYRFERDHPEAAAEGHRILARSLWSRGGPSSAGPILMHARKGGDWTLLARAWLAICWQLVLFDVPAFTTAFGGLPAEVVAELPVLRLPQRLAEGLYEAAQGGADATLVQHHYHLAGVAMMNQLSEIADPDERFSVLMAGMEASRAAGHIDQARKLVAQMDALAAPGLTRSGDHAWGLAPRSVWWHFQTGITHLLGGDMVRSMESLGTAFEMRPLGVLAPQAAALMALIHVVNGSRTDALECLGIVHDHAWHGPEIESLTALPVAVTRAMLAMDQLDRSAAEQALMSIDGPYPKHDLWPAAVVARTRYEILFGRPVEMLDELERVARHRARRLRYDPIGRGVIDRCRADLLLAMGEANLVRSVVGDGRETPPWLRKTAARLYLILGDHARADRITSAGIWAADTIHRDRASLLMIRAASALQQGQEREAGDAYERGHLLAQKSGNLEPYLSLAPAVRARLEKATGVALSPDQTRRIAHVPDPYPQSAILVELSPRELEVLARLRESGSVGAIARSLSVSINTVKKQVGSVYAKLGVHDRTAALHRAEQLGLLADSSGAHSA